MTRTSSSWTILVPVKDTRRGKSRIDLPADRRARLAMAMAMDTVTAAAQCAVVIAIVETEIDAAALGTLPGVIAHRTSVTGLNEAIMDGAKARVNLAIADSTSWIGVLPGDLPGLDAAELGRALDSCAMHRYSVVPDHQGIGTTLLAATDVAALRPQYGPDSFRLHQLAGAVPIELAPSSSLRWDIDTVADLGARLGRFTAAALR